jgi:hypothetical protein
MYAAGVAQPVALQNNEKAGPWSSSDGASSTAKTSASIIITTDDNDDENYEIFDADAIDSKKTCQSSRRIDCL